MKNIFIFKKVKSNTYLCLTKLDIYKERIYITKNSNSDYLMIINPLTDFEDIKETTLDELIQISNIRKDSGFIKSITKYDEMLYPIMIAKKIYHMDIKGVFE